MIVDKTNKAKNKEGWHRCPSVESSSSIYFFYPIINSNRHFCTINMKLSIGIFLLTAGAAPAAAFLPPKSVLDTTQLRVHGMIDADYLQSELTSFANEKLVGGSLLPSSFGETSTMLSLNEKSGISSTQSVFDGASNFLSTMVADIGNPLISFQETAMNVMTAANSAAGHHWDISSSILTASTNVMSTVDITPEIILPSMIMVTSMAVTILVSGKSSNMIEASSSSDVVIVNDYNFPLKSSASTGEIFVSTAERVLEQAAVFTPSKKVVVESIKMNNVVANSLAAVAFADSVLAATETVIDTTAEEITTTTVEPNVVATAATTASSNMSTQQSLPVVEKNAAMKSSLFTQARRMADLIVMKMKRCLLQGNLFFRALVASIRKFQKATVSVMVSPLEQTKPVFVKATNKVGLIRPLVLVKSIFSL